MTPKILALAAVLALPATGALAQNSRLPAVQRPTGSVVGVVQGQGSQRPVTDVNINQNSQNNVADVMQAGPNASANVNQTGRNNRTGVTQMGNNNRAGVNQTGRNNRTGVRQTGRTNNAAIGQSGARNSANIRQGR
jgi:minor curlin subunit